MDRFSQSLVESREDDVRRKNPSESKGVLKKPLCSVILISWNRRQELLTAIGSLLRQTVAKRLQIIVVDNGSTDGTVETLEEKAFEQVEILALSGNFGASHGRNLGILRAKAEAICFLDSDAEILGPDAIERCLDVLAHPPADLINAVSVVIWRDREKTVPFLLGGYITPEGHFWGSASRSRVDDPDFLSTCFSVWRKRTLLELRGFNPWYFWGIEDMDIALRAQKNARRGKKKAASRFYVIADRHVLHEMSEKGRAVPVEDFRRKFFSIERQRLYLVLSYGGIGEFLRVLLRSPFRLHRIEQDGWEQRLSWRFRAMALLVFPAWRLLLWPWDWLSLRKNFLQETKKRFPEWF